MAEGGEVRHGPSSHKFLDDNGDVDIVALCPQPRGGHEVVVAPSLRGQPRCRRDRGRFRPVGGRFQTIEERVAQRGVLLFLPRYR